MARASSTWPELSFPAEEADYLRNAYEKASVILEYGSGGSTKLAAEMEGKHVFSVESDRKWATRLQLSIDKAELPSPAIVYHADIGQTGLWGRPTRCENWHRFRNYPLSIWREAFFRHPDLVLIDGRFRAACMIAVMSLIEKDVTVLFDDYVDRKPYHLVERKLKPKKTVGRMAVFNVQPGLIKPADLDLVTEAFSQATIAGAPALYDSPSNKVMQLQQDAMEKRKHGSRRK
ncbi:MAG: hypothetical protein Q4F71_06740 [Paracoccus sp. (in: a-proteobacteria)]|nr:hypothetical protein [Paracoccus sp. (in: a-proteobacteria)]